jgi:Protein of unknown function (DUF3168)
MSYQSDIVAAMLADSGLSAIIGTRVFADVADGGTVAPYIVYQTVSDTGDTPFSGGRSVTFPLVQFACWSSTKTGAIAIASALRVAIEGRNLPGSSKSSLGFSNQISRRDMQTKLFGEIIDYRVSCNVN